MGEIKYRPEIDGLRAIAIIPVVLFHMGFQWIPGGFIGVDVFFVISGFLITSIILKDYEQGKFSFSDFWMRRVRRILPALIVMVVTTSIVGSFVLYAPDISNLGEQGLAALFSLANIDFWLHSGSYWGAAAKDSSFLHTWTLSVEEQFYMFFPILLILLLKFRTTHLVLILSLLSVTSALLFLYGAQYHPDATFFLLPTRAWELGSGGLLGILSYKHYIKFQQNPFLSLIGLLTIVLSYIFIDGSEGVPGYLIIPVIGAVFVIAFTKGELSLVTRFLSLPVMVYIGKLSYSLYLWHWPVLVLLKNIYPENNSIALYSIPVISLLSAASYYFVEKTTRRHAYTVRYVGLFMMASIAYLSYLFMADHSEDISLYSKATWNGRLYNNEPASKNNAIRNSENEERFKGISMSMPKIPDSMTYANGGVIKIYGKDTPELVMLGDSHANMIAGVVDAISRELGISVSFYAAGGTATFFNIPIRKAHSSGRFSSDEKYTYDKMRLHYLEVWKPKVVLIAASWAGQHAQETQDLMGFLGEIGAKVLLVEDPPELFFGNKNAPQYLAYMGLTPSIGTRKYIPRSNNTKYEKGRKLIRQLSDIYEHCDFIPVADIFIKEDKAWVLDGSDVLYIDDNHLSQSGAMKVKSRIKQKLQSYFVND